jgi:AbrB family looped-hinge helix DNA binding protein
MTQKEGAGMAAIRARVNEQGRLVIPAELRAAAGIKPGSDVVLEARDGEVRIRSVDAAVARVQEKYKRLARGRSIVDEFLAERREDATRE